MNIAVILSSSLAIPFYQFQIKYIMLERLYFTIVWYLNVSEKTSNLTEEGQKIKKILNGGSNDKRISTVSNDDVIGLRQKAAKCEYNM